ncbi:MAG: hypothetical protein V1899_06825 [Planctomycetota bacterium]
MRQISSIFGLVFLLFIAERAYGAESDGELPAPLTLSQTFNTTLDSPWVFSSRQSNLTLNLEAPLGARWDLRNCHAISIQAMRQKQGQSVTRLRWRIKSRVGGTYSSATSIVAPSGHYATIMTTLDPATSDLMPLGHQRPWDAFAAAEVVGLELRAECYFASTAADEKIAIMLNNVCFEMNSGRAKTNAVLTDVALQVAPAGYRAQAELSFRIEPPPADPYAPDGEGDVRVRLPNGKQTLAFFDQSHVIVADGSAPRAITAGAPRWRAFLPELPEYGELQIISGDHVWKLQTSCLPLAHKSPHLSEQAGETPAVRENSRCNTTMPSTRSASGVSKNETPRWAAALEVPVADIAQFSANAPAAWSLTPTSQWQPTIQNPLKSFRSLWRPVPFWNDQWDNFGGAWRANSALAQHFDSLLARAAASGESRPLVILDGDSFERQGMFNWDHHPLVGALAGPGELFRSEIGVNFCRRWIRYCIARWGRSQAVTSLCLTATLNTPGVAEFHSKIAALLLDWQTGADLPVFSLHPLARAPQIVARLASFEPQDASPLNSWRADSRSAKANGVVCAENSTDGQRCFEVRARDAASVTISLTGTYMFGTPETLAHADAILFDVWIPAQAPPDLRVGAHLCDSAGRWYETLLPTMLRPGDWTTYAIDIGASNFHELRPLKHNVAWNELSRRRMTEIGLHVYSTHPRWKFKNKGPLPVTARFDHIRAARFDRPGETPVAQSVIAAIEPETQDIALIGSFEDQNQQGGYVWTVDPRLGAADGSRVAGGHNGNKCFEVRARNAECDTVSLVGKSVSAFADWKTTAPDNFAAADALVFDVWLPSQSPPDLRAGVHLRDRDGLWFEALLPGVCCPGDWTTFALDITGENYHQLTAIAHRKAWTDYSRQRISEIGIHLFSTHPNWMSNQSQPLPLTARFDHIRLARLTKRRPPDQPIITLLDTTGESDSSNSDIYVGDLWQCRLKISKTFANPFDPRSCDLAATITLPSGKQTRVSAFLDQPCERREARPGGDEIVEPVGEECFTVRYRVIEFGAHHVKFELREGGKYQVATQRVGAVTTEKVTFMPGAITATLELPALTVSLVTRPGAKPFHGFLRTASDQRHFQYDDGSFFYPLGPCLRSPSDSRIPYLSEKWTEQEIDRLGKRGTYQYDEYFAEFEKAGINWARVWMCSWWGALEWRRDWPGYQGLGRYNLLNAWRMDHLLADAERKGIVLSLCLTNHGQYSQHIDTEWHNNPYHTQFGGPLVAAREFFTVADAKIIHQNKLRYVVARYGHSPAVMTWALFSELEFVEEFEGRNGYTGNIDVWHAEMAQFLKEFDPNRHLIATHYSHPNRGASTLAIPGIDVATSNAYSAFDELAHKSMDASAALADFWAGNQQGVRGFKFFQKPALVEEQGRHWMGVTKNKNNNTKEQLDADLHAGLWGSLVQPLGGATGYWWWLHLHFDKRYGDYRALANFMAGEDMRPAKDESMLEPIYRNLPSTNGTLRGRALKSNRRVYAWIYHPDTPQGGRVLDVSGGAFRVSGLQTGNYTVEFWDTYTGVVTETRSCAVNEGVSLNIPLPPVKRDLAIKLKPK